SRMRWARLSPTSGSCSSCARSARLRSMRPADAASRSSRVGRAPQRIEPSEETAIRTVARPSRTAIAHWAVRGQATRTSGWGGAGPAALAGLGDVWLMFQLASDRVTEEEVIIGFVRKGRNDVAKKSGLSAAVRSIQDFDFLTAYSSE